MKSCIHIYCGDGKGKSTAAMGLTVRAAGSGKKVILTQFLKSGTSSEMEVLKHLEQVTLIFCEKKFGFVWNMSEEEKVEAAKAYTEQFEKVTREAVEQNAFLLVMDEFVAAYNHGFIDHEKALYFLKTKPETLEVVLTGREPAAELVELADYVSEIKKVKHPFDEGVPARKGIEM